jgi:hypothetical protein
MDCTHIVHVYLHSTQVCTHVHVCMEGTNGSIKGVDCQDNGQTRCYLFSKFFTICIHIFINFQRFYSFLRITSWPQIF